jgi:hypothetical protein
LFKSLKESVQTSPQVIDLLDELEKNAQLYNALTTYSDKIWTGQREIIKRVREIDLFKDAQFSLVIENSRQTNYFTEKLCDCLITKTIPVYYGCPNISEYFDTSGWIILDNESMDDLINKLKILDSNYFMKYIDIIEKNFETVKQYIDIQENINRALCNIPQY